MGHSCIQLERAVIHVISLVSSLCNPSIYPNHKCWRRWSWMVLWRPIRPSRTNTKKRCPFHHRGLEYKSRKSTDTWSNRQVWPWSTEWNRAKANRILPRECTGHSKHPLPTTQETTLHVDITRCQYWNHIDYILHSRRRSSRQSAKTTLGADHGSDHEFLNVKFRL